MNDAKYLTYLGLSLTAFMGSSLFLLVMIHPKSQSYSVLPMIYACVCFAVGIATNLLAKRAESASAGSRVEGPARTEVRRLPQ